MSKKIKAKEENPDKPQVWGDPAYDEKDDIYSNATKVELSGSGDDPEAVSNAAEDPADGSELDIPGSELDDRDEKVGEEDEENNYYSLGGDNHDDLEEDNA